MASAGVPMPFRDGIPLPSIVAVAVASLLSLVGPLAARTNRSRGKLVALVAAAAATAVGAFTVVVSLMKSLVELERLKKR